MVKRYLNSGMIQRLLLWLGLATLVQLPMGCKFRGESSLRGDATAIVVDDLPPSVFGESAPFGRMPGVVLGVTPDSWGKFDRKAIDAFKAELSPVFFSGARRGGENGLFFTLVAINAENVNGLAGFFKNKKIDGDAKREMERGYNEIPRDLAARFSSDNGQLEKYVLLINDSDKVYHERFNLPTLGGYVVDRDLKRFGPYHLPRDKAAMVEKIKALMNLNWRH